MIKINEPSNRNLFMIATSPELGDFFPLHRPFMHKFYSCVRKGFGNCLLQCMSKMQPTRILLQNISIAISNSVANISVTSDYWPISVHL